MGLRLSRKKQRNLKLSLAYKIGRIIPLSQNRKLKLYLDLAWIFSRLAHEQTFKSTIKLDYDPKRDFLLNHLGKNSMVFDIGCGQGFVIERIITKTTNIVGIDYQKESIEIAKSKFGNQVELICDDLYNYLKIIRKDQFDVVILSHIIEHLEDVEDFLSEIQPIAKYFYVEVPDHEATHLNAFREKTGTDLVYTDADHIHEFDRNGLIEILNTAGFEILDSEYLGGVIKFWCKSKS